MGKLSNGMPLPAQTFEHVERLHVNVMDVRIFQGRNDFAQPDDFVVSLHDRAVLYLSKKFKTASVRPGDGNLQITIEDASVEHSEKDSASSILNAVGLDGRDEYRLRLVLRLEHRDEFGRVLHGEVLRGEKRVEISEHDSLAQREQRQFDAIEDLFTLIEPNMHQVIKDKMNL